MPSTAETRLLAACRLLGDDELRVTMACAAERAAELPPGPAADVMHTIAVSCAQVRDERAALAREVDAAANPFTVAFIERPGDSA